MGALCSKPDTHSGGHQVLGSSESRTLQTSERRPNTAAAPQTIGATPASRIPVSTAEKQAVRANNASTSGTTRSTAGVTANGHGRSPSAGSIPKSAIPIPTRSTSPPMGQKSSAPVATAGRGASKKDDWVPKKSKGKGAPTPTPEERRLAAAAAAEKRANEQQSRGVNKTNPNAGKLSSKLQDDKMTRSGTLSSREEPTLVWD